MALYPINLDVGGKRCLVVGGGKVALGKTQELLRCEAEVEVVAPLICDELVVLADDSANSLELSQRAYETGDLHGCLIAIAATGDSEVNRRVFLDGQQQGVLVNSADDPENCHFTLPARVRKGDLLVTISTAGRSPAMASWLRRQIEAYLDEDILRMLEVVADVRDEIKAQGIPTEPLDWATALNNGILELVREGKIAEAKSQILASLGIPANP